MNDHQAIDRIRAIKTPTDGTCLVAIGRHGAAGNSILSRQIANELGGVTIVCLDDFGQADAVRWDRKRFRSQVLDPLLSGRPGRYQRWDWIRTSSPNGPMFPLVERSSLKAFLDEVELYAVTLSWVDAPEDAQLKRGMLETESDEGHVERYGFPERKSMLPPGALRHGPISSLSQRLADLGQCRCWVGPNCLPNV